MLHQLEGFRQVTACLADSGAKRVGIGEEHERQPVAVIGAVQHAIFAQQPGIATCPGIAVHPAQKIDAVRDGIAILGPAELAIGHGVVEYEARAAHQVAGVRIVDRAVVPEEMKEAAARVDGARVIERHGVLDVIEQELAAAEVGMRVAGGGIHAASQSIRSSTCSTSGNVGGVAPARRQAAAPAATEKRRCVAQPASGALMRLYNRPPMLASPAPTVSTTSILGGR